MVIFFLSFLKIGDRLHLVLQYLVGQPAKGKKRAIRMLTKSTVSRILYGVGVLEIVYDDYLARGILLG